MGRNLRPFLPNERLRRCCILKYPQTSSKKSIFSPSFREANYFVEQSLPDMIKLLELYLKYLATSCCNLKNLPFYKLEHHVSKFLAKNELHFTSSQILGHSMRSQLQYYISTFALSRKLFESAFLSTKQYMQIFG